ncbi:MAG: integration host factor subunit alpha [Deltaproteobacteria bacterium]|nr:integration host factor subunit alpha [Deltaproteobacteria bacterium]
MTKADIVRQIQAKVGFSRQKTAEVVDDLFEIMKETLEKGEPVKISGFGNFEVRQKNARKGRNPQTGESIIIPQRRVLSFKPSQLLKKAINNVF